MSRSHPGLSDRFPEAVIEYAAEGVLAVDGDGTVVFTNPAADRLLADEVRERGEDPVGEPIAAFGPDDESDAAGPSADGDPGPLAGATATAAATDRLTPPEEFVAATFDADEERTGRIGLRGADGGIVPAAASAAPAEIDGRRHVLLFLQDVGDRLRRDAELRGYEEVVETVGDGIYRLDADGRIVAVNDVVVEQTGYAREELLGEDISLLLDDEDIVACAEAIRELLTDDDRETATLRFDVHAADGRAIPCEAQMTALTRDGEFRGTVGLVRDVSGRVERDAEIRRQSAAIEATSDGMAILDAEERYVYVNEAHAEIFGHEPGALVGESWHRLFGEDEGDRGRGDGADAGDGTGRLTTEVLPAVRATGDWRGEVTGRRPDGTTFPGELTVTELNDGGLVYAVRDVTERKAHVRKLEALTEVTGGLMTAGSPDEIARRAVEAVDYVLGFSVSCVRLFDDETNALEPAATSDEARRLVERCPGFDLDRSAAGRAFRRGERVESVVEDDLRAGERVDVHLPLGDRGTLSVFTDRPAVDEADLHHLEMLAADVTTAIGRAERETRLRRNERELRQHRDELETLNRINTLISELIRQLVAKTTREEIYRTVCDRLASSPFYESAWIGAAETADGRIDPVAESGLDEGYLQVIERLPVEYLANGVVAEAIRTGEFQLVHQYVAHEGGIGADVTRDAGAADETGAGADGVHDGARETRDSDAGDGTDDVGTAEDRPGVDEVRPGGVGVEDGTGGVGVDDDTSGVGVEDGTGIDGADGERVGGVDGADGERSVETVAAIPLSYGDRTHGVLVVEARRDDVFSDTARTALSVLGDAVGFVITAALHRELLHSDVVVELEFAIADDRCLPVAVSGELGCRCRLEKVTPLGEGDYRLYLQFEGTDPDAAVEALSRADAVSDCRLVRESEGEPTFLVEVTTAETVFPALLEVGASAPVLVAEEGEGRLTVEVSPTTNVRDVAERLRELYPEAEMRRKRELDRPVKTTTEFRRGLRDRLTEKQRLAIETAYVVGYYDWPRQQNAKEIAASLDVSAPTFHQHLRKAERKLVDAFFDDPGPLSEE